MDYLKCQENKTAVFLNRINSDLNKINHLSSFKEEGKNLNSYLKYLENMNNETDDSIINDDVFFLESLYNEKLTRRCQILKINFTLY